MLGFSISILTLTSHSYGISLTMSKSHPYQNPLAAYCRRGSWGIILRNSHCVWMWLFPHKIMNLRSLEKGFCQIFSLIWQVTSNGCYLHLNWLISIQKIDKESSKSGLKCHCQSDWSKLKTNTSENVWCLMPGQWSRAVQQADLLMTPKTFTHVVHIMSLDWLDDPPLIYLVWHLAVKFNI